MNNFSPSPHFDDTKGRNSESFPPMKSITISATKSPHSRFFDEEKGANISDSVSPSPHLTDTEGRNSESFPPMKSTTNDPHGRFFEEEWEISAAEYADKREKSSTVRERIRDYEEEEVTNDKFLTHHKGVKQGSSSPTKGITKSPHSRFFDREKGAKISDSVSPSPHHTDTEGRNSESFPPMKRTTNDPHSRFFEEEWGITTAEYADPRGKSSTVRERVRYHEEEEVTDDKFLTYHKGVKQGSSSPAKGITKSPLSRFFDGEKGAKISDSVSPSPLLTDTEGMNSGSIPPMKSNINDPHGRFFEEEWGITAEEYADARGKSSTVRESTYARNSNHEEEEVTDDNKFLTHHKGVKQGSSLFLRHKLDGDAIKAFMREVNLNLYQREQTTMMCMLAMFLKQHVFLFAPPGCGKTFLVDKLAKRIFGAEYNSIQNFFSVTLHTTSPREDLVGPVDIKEMTSTGRTVTLMDGYIPTSKLAFIDEIFKASKGTLSSLLTLLQERRLKDGDRTIETPLWTVISASNEVFVEEDQAALLDRFHIRVPVMPLDSTMHNYSELYQIANGTRNGVNYNSPRSVMSDHKESTSKDKSSDHGMTCMHWFKQVHSWFKSDKRNPFDMMSSQYDISFLQAMINEANHRSRPNNSPANSVSIPMAGFSMQSNKSLPSAPLVTDRRVLQLLDAAKFIAISNGRDQIFAVDFYPLIHYCWKQWEDFQRLQKWFFREYRMSIYTRENKNHFDDHLWVSTTVLTQIQQDPTEEDLVEVKKAKAEKEAAEKERKHQEEMEQMKRENRETIQRREKQRAKTKAAREAAAIMDEEIEEAEKMIEECDKKDHLMRVNEQLLKKKAKSTDKLAMAMKTQGKIIEKEIQRQKEVDEEIKKNDNTSESEKYRSPTLWNHLINRRMEKFKEGVSTLAGLRSPLRNGRWGSFKFVAEQSLIRGAIEIQSLDGLNHIFLKADPGDISEELSKTTFIGNKKYKSLAHWFFLHELPIKWGKSYQGALPTLSERLLTSEETVKKTWKPIISKEFQTFKNWKTAVSTKNIGSSGSENMNHFHQFCDDIDKWLESFYK